MIYIRDANNFFPLETCIWLGGSAFSHAPYVNISACGCVSWRRSLRHSLRFNIYDVYLAKKKIYDV
jgi:hypothetical protein